MWVQDNALAVKNKPGQFFHIVRDGETSAICGARILEEVNAIQFEVPHRDDLCPTCWWRAWQQKLVHAENL